MSDTPPTFGLMLSNRGPVLGYSTPTDLITLGESAEVSGLFNTVWSGDAFLTNPRLDAVTLLTAVAARTERVRLGPACMGSFTQRAALDLAYQWASLDQISGGRTVMVACAGGGSGEAWAREDRNTGVSSADRRALMWERIELFHRLFAEESVTFRGRFHDYEQVGIIPRPLNQPSPIWAATNITRLASGGSAGRMPVKTLAKVGEICDGWMTHSVNPETFAEAWSHIRASATAHGKDADAMDNALVVNICVRDDPEEALAETGDFLADYYGIRFSPERTRDWTAHGSPEVCAATLRSYGGSGVKHMALRMTSRDQNGQFERLINEVLPLVNTA
ncbi:MAG: LLM class flavin-dependent oxidoreductase [Alphaproteobacteria bacterium]|jgi:alkanesulfonate monooxygenase SsuD/methylene tetrahydromethanopterin reductase-like flavin-dependent oxidoreductase (luciferase family)|nr:LLM class flavin-dependent oxidoreductase [Alphaproteobacteria bacterium]